VTAAQASALTLTLTEVAMRPVQVWVRTAGAIDASRRTVSAVVEGAEAARIRVGQRVRAFPPESRSSMYQARVVRVERQPDGARVVAELVGPARAGSTWYVLEIVTEDGEYLSVPNEAIIEAGGRRLVYVAEGEGRYAPREIEIGLQGELYTAVQRGLAPGERVVTFGSFFIDAEHRLKGP
jgi:Cu(I)/Ag(I) efflux system membrane fusion protein